ncbi:hypothetical protein D3C72_2386400 [compost metagenome]
MGQQQHAQRNAQQSARDEGQQMRRGEPPAHRERRQQLPGQGAEHRQRRRQLRIHRPGPERHGHHAEAEARQTLHETRGHGAHHDQYV